MSARSVSEVYRFPGGFVLGLYMVGGIAAVLAAIQWSDRLSGLLGGILAGVAAVAVAAAVQARVVVTETTVDVCWLFRRRSVPLHVIEAVVPRPLFGGATARNTVVALQVGAGQFVTLYPLVGGAAVGGGGDRLPRWLSWGQTVSAVEQAIRRHQAAR